MQGTVIVTFLTLFFTVIVLTATGYLQMAADMLKIHVGVWAHFIFFGLFLYTGLFFGYGWSFFIISSGYTLGWSAVITANLGTVVGGIIGFVSSRRCMRSAVERKVKSFPGSWSRRIKFFTGEIERSTVAYLLVSGTMRNSNMLTFGMCNAFDGAMTNVSLCACVLCLLVTSQHIIVLDVYIGTLVDDFANPTAGTSGNGTSISPEEEAARRTLLIVQIAIIVSFLVLVTCLARCRLRRLEREHLRSQHANTAELEGLPA